MSKPNDLEKARKVKNIIMLVKSRLDPENYLTNKF